MQNLREHYTKKYVLLYPLNFFLLEQKKNLFASF